MRPRGATWELSAIQQTSWSFNPRTEQGAAAPPAAPSRCPVACQE